MHTVKELLRYVCETSFLPPAFQLMPQVLLLLQESDVHGEKLAEVIRVDAGLTADVLRVCNSAQYGGRCKVDTIQDALIRIGLNELYRIVMKVIVSPGLSQPHAGYGPRADLWHHSLATGIAAEQIAARTDASENLAFTAGLLHDLGKTVMSQFLQEKYRAIISYATENQLSLLHSERHILGMDHAEVGAELLSLWNFPENLVAAVRWHHDPLKGGDHAALAASAYTANAVAFLAGEGFGHETYMAALDPAILNLVGVTQGDLESFSQATSERLERERAALQ